MNPCEKLFIATAITAAMVLPFMGNAESLSTLSEIPGFENMAQSTDGGLSVFINSIYRMSIGLGSALAVIVITTSGIQYAMSDAFGVKEDMKGRITKALGGLLLLMGAFIFLEYVNPDLVKINIQQLDSVVIDESYFDQPLTVGEVVPDYASVSFVGGVSDPNQAQQLTSLPVTDYISIFRRVPLDARVRDGRVELNQSERIEILQSTDNAGSLGLELTGNGSDDVGLNITPNAQRTVAAAITGLCPEIPLEWATEPGLYSIIARESGGIVGRPNYALQGYMNANNVSALRLRQDIRLNRFYSNHCCRVTSQSGREAEQNGTVQCNPGANSGLMQYTQAQANAGTNGYGHVAGQCTSAAGIGQLLNANMVEYQPSGVQGYGNAAEEICGMLKYIQSRPDYGTPAAAWARYRSGIGY